MPRLFLALFCLVVTCSNVVGGSLNTEIKRLNHEQKWLFWGIDDTKGISSISSVSLEEFGKANHVMTIGGYSDYLADLSASKQGDKLAYKRGMDDCKLILVENGNSKEIYAHAGIRFTSVSPDAKKVLFTAADQNKMDLRSLYLFDMESQKTTLIDTCVSWLCSQAWSPDSKMIIYESFKNKGSDSINDDPGKYEILLANVETGEIRKIVNGKAPSWAPNGKRIAYRTGWDKYFIINVDGSEKKHLMDRYSLLDILKGFLVFPYEVSGSVLWSPDSKYILFRKNRYVFDSITTTYYIMEIDTLKTVKLGKLDFEPTVWFSSWGN